VAAEPAPEPEPAPEHQPYRFQLEAARLLALAEPDQEHHSDDHLSNRTRDRMIDAAAVYATLATRSTP
jgi:hypothetical protein